MVQLKRTDYWGIVMGERLYQKILFGTREEAEMKHKAMPFPQNARVVKVRIEAYDL